MTTSSSIQNILLSDCSGSGGHTFYITQLQFTYDEQEIVTYILISHNYYQERALRYF